MSTINEIKDKKVNYQVIKSVNDLNIKTDEDHGKLSAIVSDDNKNAIYVGDTHIASGYGLKSSSTVAEVEKLLSNENIRKLLNTNTIINPDVTPDVPDGNQNILPDTVLYIKNDDTIYVEEGELKSTSWLNITDIVVGYKVNDSTIKNFKKGDTIEFSMTDNIIIDSIRFSFTIKFDSINLGYKLIFDDSESVEFQNLNPLVFDGSMLDGKTHSITLSNLNLFINKDLNKIVSEVPVKIYFKDDESKYQTLINIGKIIFKYKIFSTYGENNFDISSIDFNSENVLYDIVNGAIVQIGSNDNNYKHYIMVPSIIKEPSFILKSSNIGCNFNKYIGNYNLNDYDLSLVGNYDIYESIQKYNTIVIWIVK